MTLLVHTLRTRQTPLFFSSRLQFICNRTYTFETVSEFYRKLKSCKIFGSTNEKKTFSLAQKPDIRLRQNHKHYKSKQYVRFKQYVPTLARFFARHSVYTFQVKHFGPSESAILKFVLFRKHRNHTILVILIHVLPYFSIKFIEEYGRNIVVLYYLLTIYFIYYYYCAVTVSSTMQRQ